MRLTRVTGAAAAGLALAFAWQAVAAPPAEDRWTRPLDTAALLGAAEVEGVQLQPRDGGDGRSDIVFDDPTRQSGEVVIDLSGLGDLSGYDELHYELKLEHGIVEPAVTLAGYPDARSSRRWFFKRFPRVGEWETVRLDLDLDDDRSTKRGRKDERSLTLQFSRPAAQPTLPAQPPVARVRDVRLVRRPVSVTLDPRGVVAEERDGRWTFGHPVSLVNRSDEPQRVELTVVDEAAGGAEATLSESAVTLGPGEERQVVATLALPAGAEAGRVARARVEATLPDAGLTLEPIRGYRPVFLLAVAPPTGVGPEALAAGEAPDAERLLELDAAVSRRLEVVRDVVPRYEDHFRCEACGHRLRAIDLRRYHCVNKDCSERGEVIAVTEDDPLFASYLSIYHKENAALAADLARAFVATGDRRYAEAAERWLLDYAAHLGELPIVSAQSTGFHSRLSSATLFEKESLLPFTDAFLLLRARGVLDDGEAQRVEDGLIVPLLYDVNLHHYGASAGQVNFILATLKAAAAVERWWFFADALAGDAGVGMILSRGFDADGIGVEGGAYATSAAERIVALGDFLETLGLSGDRGRIEEIERNSRRIGLLGGEPWEPVVLEDTGFAVLVQGEGPMRRRATINWRRPRDRGEHDLLSYDFADAEGPLIRETGRIAYGHKQSKLMLRSMAHNTPVVDGGDIADEPMELRSVGRNEQAAWCVVGSHEGSPAYPGVAVSRAVVLVRGVLLVADRVASEGGGPRTIDLPIYGVGDGEIVGARAAPLEKDAAPHGPFEDAWRVSGPASEATLLWRDGDEPALRMRYVGDPVRVLAGETIGGWTGERRDLFVLRAEGAGLEAATVYESLRASSPRVARVEASGGSEGGARRYTIVFDDGSRATVELPPDGEPRVEVSAG